MEADTSASPTLVRTSGRREWMSSFCSVSTASSSVSACSAPTVCSSVTKLAPLSGSGEETG